MSDSAHSTPRSLHPPTSHRAYPAPARPWSMFMRWHDLLFMHWPAPRECLQRLIGPALPVDEFNGSAWLGIVPFRMSGIRARRFVALPWLSAFPELNVRTYVTLNDMPGVYFFTLDAAHRVAVEVARRAFRLNYLRSKMSVIARDDWIHYDSRRMDRRGPPAELALRYRPTGPVTRALPGQIDHWLTERYCLYTLDHLGRPLRGHIDHAPWPLQTAAAEVRVNSKAAALGIELPNVPPLLHYAQSLDVRAWMPQPVS